MKATTLAKIDRPLRQFVGLLPPGIVIKSYSKGRFYFLKEFSKDEPKNVYLPPKDLAKIVWGLKFQTPLYNAAGMFKNGESYNVVASQGAGAYLGGTSTWNSREGNSKEGFTLPFAPYPISHASSNWLGLPNHGDEINSQKVRSLKPIEGCPRGWSLMSSPDLKGEEKLIRLIDGMKKYNQAGIDFIEINESCPNTLHGKPQEDNLANRLRYIQEKFLKQRERNLPVIVKFSNDTDPKQLPALMDLLFKLGYDGVNFGNTSTQYDLKRKFIAQREKKLYDFFVNNFGGGISGRPLRESSLELASKAVEYLKAGAPTQEFHIIRTGGIESLKDIQDSERAGISLNQWFTGYFENFSKSGHDVYKNIFSLKK